MSEQNDPLPHITLTDLSYFGLCEGVPNLRSLPIKILEVQFWQENDFGTFFVKDCVQNRPQKVH